MRTGTCTAITRPPFYSQSGPYNSPLPPQLVPKQEGDVEGSASSHLPVPLFGCRGHWLAAGKRLWFRLSWFKVGPIQLTHLSCAPSVTKKPEIANANSLRTALFSGATFTKPSAI